MKIVDNDRRQLLGLATGSKKTPKLSNRFSNHPLRTQSGQDVNFYTDLVKDRITIVNFFYTHCQGICLPTTANLLLVHQRLGARVGKEILFLSLTLEPERDTPAKLHQYASLFGNPHGWLFLTGKYEHLEELRYQLGAYDLDPIIDADKEQHTGLVIFGNDRSNRWAALPALMDADGLARSIRRITR